MPLYIVHPSFPGDELWSCAPDAPGSATLVGAFPAGLTIPVGITDVGGTLYIVDTGGDELWSCVPDAPGSATLVGTFPGTITSPLGITNAGGTFYIVDNTGDELWSCAPDAPGSAGLVGTFPADLTSPQGITSVNGTLYIASGDELWSCAPDAPGSAVLVGTFPADLTSSQGITSVNGTLFIADNTGDELWSCAPDAPGSAVLVGTFPAGLASPFGITYAPPPVTGGVTVSVDGVDASDDVLGSPPVVTQRGSTRRANPFVPQVDSAELTLRSAAPVEDRVAIAVRQVNPARTLFSGTVAEAQNRDTLASNLASIRAVGPLAALSTPGPSVALMTAPLVSEAVEALLEACGIVAAERAIEASTRRLHLFWLASTAQPIRILQQLVATDGPGARLYVDGGGLVRYEPDGTRSTQARSTAVQATYDAAARVTSVPAARNVSVNYEAEDPQALKVTVERQYRFSRTSQAQATTITGVTLARRRHDHRLGGWDREGVPGYQQHLSD